MAKKKYGQCHLCGKNAQLTFEHVPPKKAFNKYKALMYLGRNVIETQNFPWDFSGIRGEELQRGMGAYTLCGKCNNDTGSWYGDAFVDFVYQGYENIKKIGDKRIIANKEWLDITFHDIYPLRIIKQVVVMFLSVNSSGLSSVHSDLKRFLLNRHARGFSCEMFGLYLYVLRGALMKRLGLSGILDSKEGATRILSEISAPPFGYVLEIKPRTVGKYCNIASFGNEFGYDDKRTVHLRMPVYECNSYFPADYRTREEIMRDYIKNQLWKMNNE